MERQKKNIKYDRLKDSYQQYTNMKLKLKQIEQEQSYKNQQKQLSNEINRISISPFLMNSKNIHQIDLVFTQKSEKTQIVSPNINILEKIIGDNKCIRKRDRKKKNKKILHKKKEEIKNVIANQKVLTLKQFFIQKLKRNNQYSPPVNHVFEQDERNISILDVKGIQIKQHIDMAISLVCLINVLATIYITSLSIVFQEIRNHPVYWWYKVLSFFIFGGQIFLNFITVRFSLGRKLDTLKLIGKDYNSHRLNIDLVNIMFVVLNILVQSWQLNLMCMISLLKLPESMQKLEKLQVYFIENYYNQQYWQLIKVLIFNFCFAHVLSILLVGMASINDEDNWIKTRKIQNAAWGQKYIWAYYWGTTLMLTIGFGDITPICYQEAICMVFIQTISCIILAYNISYVGKLITNIRSQDIQKSKRLKIFRKLVNKNKMNEQTSWKINNYIEENANMKKMFNIDQEKSFVDTLPVAYRTEYLKEANKAIFNQLFFLGGLMQKTLFSLAQNIEMKVTHPEEIVLQKETNLDLFILKSGEIGFMSEKKNRNYSRYIIDRVKVQQNEKPFLLNTNFITGQRSFFVVKSIVYSILYFLSRQKLMSILRENSIDFQIFCMMKDKCKFKIDQFEVFPCDYCNTKHTKFDCPKLHYMPIAQHTINKFLYCQKNNNNCRNANFFRKRQIQSALTNFSCFNELYQQKAKISKQKQLTQNQVLKKSLVKQIKSMAIFSSQENHLKSSQFFQENHQENQKFRMQKIHKNIIQNTQQVMKFYLSKTKTTSTYQDSIWLLDLDCMKNYKNFFPYDNPCNVQKKFDIDNRLKKIHKQQINNAFALIVEDQKQFLEKTSKDRKRTRTFHIPNTKKLILKSITKSLLDKNNICFINKQMEEDNIIQEQLA